MPRPLRNSQRSQILRARRIRNGDPEALQAGHRLVAPFRQGVVEIHPKELPSEQGAASLPGQASDSRRGTGVKKDLLVQGEILLQPARRGEGRDEQRRPRRSGSGKTPSVDRNSQRRDTQQAEQREFGLQLLEVDNPAF